MKKKEGLIIKQLFEATDIEFIIDHKQQLRNIEKTNILKQQEINCTQYNKKENRLHNIASVT